MLNQLNSPMFADRRKRNIPTNIPTEGCRRKGSRHTDKKSNAADEHWYLLTNYVDEK